MITAQELLSEASWRSRTSPVTLDEIQSLSDAVVDSAIDRKQLESLARLGRKIKGAKLPRGVVYRTYGLDDQQNAALLKNSRFKTEDRRSLAPVESWSSDVSAAWRYMAADRDLSGGEPIHLILAVPVQTLDQVFYLGSEAFKNVQLAAHASGIFDQARPHFEALAPNLWMREVMVRRDRGRTYELCKDVRFLVIDLDRLKEPEVRLLLARADQQLAHKIESASSGDVYVKCGRQGRLSQVPWGAKR